MKPIWTKDQQKVIDLRDRNILVSAAAGSGKTAVLVERIVKMITDKDHPVDIDRLIVVTFTKAAAGEMKSRINDALEKLANDNPEDENIERQLSLIHNAQITTIDSFCQYILRNYFYIIGLDPGFTIADETELTLMRAEVISQLLEDKYAQALACDDQAFLTMMEMFAPGRTDDKIVNIIQQLYTAAQSYPWPMKQLAYWKTMYEYSDLSQMLQSEWMKDILQDTKQMLSEICNEISELCDICKKPSGPEKYIPALESDKKQLQYILEAQDYQEMNQRITQFDKARLTAIRDKDVDPDLKTLVQEKRKEYLSKGIEKLVEHYYFQDASEMFEDMKSVATPVQQLISLTEEFASTFAERKTEEGVIDFSDMEHFALQILMEENEQGTMVPSAVAKELQQHYIEILTDEYQDSNYVQEMILTSICQGKDCAPHMFMVGDVKQSIYRFRLARPDLFLKKYHQYSLEDSKEQKILLHNNFRSRPEVLESANYIFERIMFEELGGIAYDQDARLVPGATFGETEHRTASKTELLLLELDSELTKEVGKRKLEAVAIGQRIREMVQSDNPMYVKEGDAYRPIQYRDIAILLRSLSGWSEDFVETLTNMGIPVHSMTKTGYYQTIEVQTVLNFLRIIDNPRQDIPLVAVLRSMMFSFSDEELAYLGSDRERLNYWDVLCKVEQGEVFRESIEQMESLRKKVSHFMRTWKAYRDFSASASVYEILERIYKETNYYDYVSVMPAGEQKAANLDALRQQALTFAKRGHTNIYDFCKHIEHLRKSEIDFGEASLLNDSANAVQIMTIHKSKGLEYPVVFVAGMGKQFNQMDARNSTVIDNDLGLGVEYVDVKNRFRISTLLRRYIQQRQLRADFAEEVRVLYVALTRAKEQLIITGSAKKLSKLFSDSFWSKSMIKQKMISGLNTYLHWFLLALADRPAFQSCMASLENQELSQDGIVISKEDGLFQFLLVTPEYLMEHEAQTIEDTFLKAEELSTMDTELIYDKNLAEIIKQEKSFCYPYTDSERIPVKVSVSDLKHQAMQKIDWDHQLIQKDDENEYFESLAKKPQTISAAELGTLYHLVMELLPYDQIGNDYDYEKMLFELENQGYLSEEERNALDSEKFRFFMATKLGKRMAKAHANHSLHREQQFMIGITPEEYLQEESVRKIPDEPVLVQGIIDAYFEEEDGLVLVDYKTDKVSVGQEQILCDRYQTQLDYYTEALERLTQKKVKEKIIYSFALGKELILS